MKLEFSFNQPDEISLGIFLAYGEDNKGQFHMTTLGFLIFEIDLIVYI